METLKQQIPEMKAKMGDLKAKYDGLDYKHDYAMGLTEGAGDETTIFFADEELE
jgi:hypothetical protein